MAVTGERAARGALVAIVVALLAAVWTVRLPQFWGDGATYYSMAWSLAEDLDLRYEARDVFRVRREFPMGPQGIFLKRTSGGVACDPASGFPWLERVPPEEPRVYFAKAFLHPLVAAPFVRLLGTRGLLVLNVLSFGVALWVGYGELRRKATPWAALFGTVALLFATVAPVYLLWPAPEAFGLGLIAAALAAWRGGRPYLSAVLFGLAVYLKPYNLFLALPLGVSPLLDTDRPWLERWRHSVTRGLVLAGTVCALFGLNRAVTGEFNYQGGERKTFYGRFPFESHDVTFGNSGQWMTTDHLGPLVEGADEEKLSRRTGPLRAPDEVRRSFVRNLGYFWVGRFGGALGGFFPVLLALVLFLAAGPRDAAGWLAVAALTVSYVFYIWMIPDNWYGGGGTVGNRYFLNLLPLAFVFLPKGRAWVVAGVGAVASALFLAPVWMAPLHHSLRPGDHAMRPPFRALPAELTMLNDLSVFTEAWRKKQPYGDTEGDPHRHWPADPKAYYLYFTDGGTFGRETAHGREGFWTRGGSPGEVILRALEPVREMTVAVTGGPAGDDATVRVGGREERISVGPGETRSVRFQPPPGFPYYDTFLHVVRLQSGRTGAEPAPGGRPLGSFVSIALEVNRRPRR
jgi:hypothetical protein